MRQRALLFALASVFGMAGCDKARRLPGDPTGSYEVPLGDPTGGPGGPTGVLSVERCTRCHGEAGLDNSAADPLVAAAPSGASGSMGAAAGAHLAHLQDGPFRKGVECASCHLLPTSSDHPAQKQGEVSFSRLSTTSWMGPPVSPTWDGATCTSTYCHGNFPNGANAAPAWADAGSVVCGSCHAVSATNGPGGTHLDVTGRSCGDCHTGYTIDSVDLATHMNGRVDGGESYGGTSCGSCHSTIWSAMGGAVAKATRHSLLQDVPSDDATAWTGATLSGVAISSRSCVNMCHGDHPHDLTSPAVSTHQNNAYADASDQTSRGGTTRTSATRSSTDFDDAQANGGLCASCHQRPIAAGGPSVSKGAFGPSAHNFASKTVGASTYSWSYTLHDGGSFVRNCTKCHASRSEGTAPAATANGSGTTAVHYSDQDASLLAGTKRPAGTAAGFVCYNCHGNVASPGAGAQGDRSGKDIQSQIEHATAAGQSGHPANSDSVHDSAAEFGAGFGTALGGAGRHANCLDCHDPHEAKAGDRTAQSNVAGPPLEGAWGARLSTDPAFWTAPAGTDFTKTTIVAGTDVEATLCFKCHSSYYWGAGTPPSSPSLGAAQTDTAKEFNPSNVGNFAGTWASGETAGGFHPVLASAGSNLGATGNIKTPWTRTSLMTCTDCHESDVTTDPNGPHGSAAKFILKGPNTTWDATLCNSSTGMPNGTFCINCHNQDFTGSRFPAHTSRDKHYNRNATCDVKCFHCHSAVPHGGPRPGLLVAKGGACTAQGTAGGHQSCQGNVGGVIAGWDQTSPYAGNPAGNFGLYIMGYPTNNTTNWDQNNCGCGTNGGH